MVFLFFITAFLPVLILFCFYLGSHGITSCAHGLWRHWAFTPSSMGAEDTRRPGRVFPGTEVGSKQHQHKNSLWKFRGYIVSLIPGRRRVPHWPWAGLVSGARADLKQAPPWLEGSLETWGLPTANCQSPIDFYQTWLLNSHLPFLLL